MQIFLNLLRPFDEHQRQHVITMENDNGHDGQDFTQGWNLKMYRPIVVILFILLTLAALVEIGLISLG
jgi:hypothetical protein